ncbi:50S ribosomal protein L1 [Candidatus Saccharibacteria bacterium]|nr:MAG: 50S ribosomal protein L1 [Candidatus Saccharibacteria bacterium]PID99378.1 MAG: 50S ribosomal protein L1 [Candidatus Saccharibacteria bacterium]
MPKSKKDDAANAAALELEAQAAASSATQDETEETAKKETASAADTSEQDSKAEVKTAKAGKRSAKGIEEAEAKAEKIEHQKHRSEEAAEEAEKPKQPVKPTRSRLERRSKAYRTAAEQIEKGKLYSLAEAMELAAKTSTVKFDASVELHVNLAVDPRQADQNIRTNLILPQGTGKTVRVAVFADEKAEGADISGVEALTKQLEKGQVAFDTLIATPATMPKLGKYARLLGPRGLMPNPKSGTVTTDLQKAVAEAKAGRVEYRVDSTGIVHLAIGKVSFGGTKLLENAEAVMASIKNAKPQSVKGVFIKAIHATTTMGPAITINPNE